MARKVKPTGTGPGWRLITPSTPADRRSTEYWRASSHTDDQASAWGNHLVLNGSVGVSGVATGQLLESSFHRWMRPKFGSRIASCAPVHESSSADDSQSPQRLPQHLHLWRLISGMQIVSHARCSGPVQHGQADGCGDRATQGLRPNQASRSSVICNGADHGTIPAQHYVYQVTSITTAGAGYIPCSFT
jgi:hypothetical protein